jgi:putative toxin-antitoxin system antitoxin component (TIGR02293 family)
MVATDKISDVMGDMEIRVGSLRDLDEAVIAGLPKSALRNTVRHVFAGSAEQLRFLYQVVPEATFKRRRDRLSAAESERTERLARVVATAQHVWENEEQAREFLTTPHPLLSGKMPIAAALTELGARQVEQILFELFYGLPV